MLMQIMIKLNIITGYILTLKVEISEFEEQKKSGIEPKSSSTKMKNERSKIVEAKKSARPL